MPIYRNYIEVESIYAAVGDVKLTSEVCTRVVTHVSKLLTAMEKRGIVRRQRSGRKKW